MQETPYLTTDEAAAYLRLKERKLYDMAAHGAVPCSKVTGKWLFPRAALDRWVEAGLHLPEGAASAAPPPIIGGSHDPLLDWAARRAASGLALMSEGSEAGLDRLGANKIAIAAIHLHDQGADIATNEAAVAARADLADAVVIGFARREVGLLLASGNPHGVTSLADAVAGRLTFGMRQRGAGAQLMLERLLARAALPLDRLNLAPGAHPTGSDLALAIRAGSVDCGIASAAVARTLGLDFVPIGWEAFDLVMRRRSYFEPGPQGLLAVMRQPEFARQAALLGGYDLSESGRVRLNR